MKKFLLKITVSCLFLLLLTGCGLSIYNDWRASGGKAITGGGAVAGKDYVNGLLPNAESRKYFAKLSANSNQPIETVSRTDDNPSKSGVRFVKNGGIVIPPGVTISFTNKGYCMDPHLPAPVANEEYQLVPVSMLIPEDLQGTYKKLVRKASSGDENVKRNMQHLVWALRTAGTDAPYANNLTAEQKRILNRCSEYSGQFEEFNANAKANSKMLKELIGLADSFLNVKIGGVTYKASDLLDPDIGNKKINEHLNQLITMGKSLSVERSGFNYGELQSGIYTDIRGSGYLQYTAKIANSTNKEFIFYPTDYAGQVGSGTKSQGLTFFAMANTSQYQRVTGGEPDEIGVISTDSDGICSAPQNYNTSVKISYDNVGRYRNVESALAQFQREVIKKTDSTQCNVEYVAHIWKDEKGHIRITKTPQGLNVNSDNDGSMIGEIFWERNRGGFIVHSHPASFQSEKFSKADAKFVLATGRPLVLYDTNSYNFKILRPADVNKNDLKSSYNGSQLNSKNFDAIFE